jgi:molecular chaperone HtpG
MELNPGHPILGRLFERYETNNEDPVIDDYAELLFGFGLLAEGGEMPDVVRFNRALADLMARNLEGAAPSTDAA